MWLIWDVSLQDWVRELPSKVDDGRIAILAFASKRAACLRASKHFGYDSYAAAKLAGWVEVKKIASPANLSAMMDEVVRK